MFPKQLKFPIWPFLVLPTSLAAADFNWTGASPISGGNSNMSNGANWNGGTAPPNTGGTADLIFSGIARNTPNADVDYTLNTIRFTSPQGFTVGGNPITLQTDASVPPLIRNEATILNRINNNLTFSNSGTIHAREGNLTFGGVLGTGLTAGNTITLNADASRTVIFNSSIGGFGSLSKTGDGRVVFNALVANTGTITMGGGTMELSGQIAGTSGITLTGGTIRLLANNRIPTVPFAMSTGSTLDLDGFSDEIGPLSGSGTVQIGAGGNFTVNQSTNTTFSGSIMGTSGATFTKSGSGILSLEGSTGIVGPTTVAAGTLRALQDFSLPFATPVHIASGATLGVNGTTQFIGSLTGSGTINHAGGSLSVYQAVDAVFDGQLSGTAASSFTKTSPATLTLAAASSGFNGSATVDQGRLVMRQAAALGTAVSTITVANTGTLELDRTSLSLSANKTLSLAGSGFDGLGSLRVHADTSNKSATVLGSINITSPATVKMERDGEFVSTLTFGNSSDIGAAGLGLSAHGLTISGESPGTFRCYSAISGSGPLVLDVPGPKELHAASPSFTGPFTVTRGNFNPLHPNALGGGGQPLTVGPAASLTLSQPSYSPTRPLVLDGEMTTSIESSWLATGDILASPGSVIRAANLNATLTLGGSGKLAGTGPFTFSCEGNGTIQVNRPIEPTGTTAIIKNGNGPLLIHGACDYTGQTTVNAGTLRPGAPGLLSSSSLVTVASGATLDLAGHAQTVASLSGSGTVSLGSADITLLPSASTSFNGTITGSGGLKVGTAVAGATQTLASGNSFTGPTEILPGGLLTISSIAANALSASSRLTIAGGGVVTVSASSTSVGSLAGSGILFFNQGGASIIFGGDNSSTTFSGAVTGTGSITKVGTGTFTLAANANTNMSGNTVVGEGIFIAKGGLASSSVTVQSNGTLQADGTLASLNNLGIFEIGTLPSLHQVTVTNTCTLRSGSTLRWSISNWAAASGTGSDQIQANLLHIAATSLAPAAIRIDAPASLLNFTDTPKTFVIASSTQPITGFDPAALPISYLENGANIPGTWQLALSGDGRDLLLHYTPSTGDTYQSWIAGFNLPGQDGPNADPDGDGIPNAIEYVIAGDPKNVDDSAKFPTSTVSGDHLEFVFRRTTRSLYLDPGVFYSNTLQAPWTRAVNAIDGVTITTSAIDGQTDEVTVRIPMAGEPRRFARLEVTIP